MELVIKEGAPVGLGDTVLYINNGTRKSHGDVQKKKDEVILNCYLVNEKDLIENPDLLGEYNVPRYIAAFNKRIEPLLVVFSPEIRDEILIEDPKDRPFFTKKQTELVRGYPRRDGDQDTLEEVLTLSDTEIAYWRHVEIDPYYMYIDDTLEMVDTQYVDKNKKIVKDLSYQPKTTIPKDELYDVDDDGNYIYSMEY